MIDQGSDFISAQCVVCIVLSCSLPFHNSFELYCEEELILIRAVVSITNVYF